jgi:lysyl-tRNA synthetase, class I
MNLGKMENKQIKNKFESSNAWPFVEARALLKKINYKTPNKGFVLFETGYGPSGLPHIGTFGEVARTTMVRNAFIKLAPNIPTKLICFSDDMDGLRKVPDNIPNSDILYDNLGKALTNIPDPYQEHSSYGANMNNRLKKFLDNFGFEYEFYSSTKCYKDGIFNNALKNLADNYAEITNLVKATLREERRASYSPFMPVCPITNKILETGVKALNIEDYTIDFIDSNGDTQNISIFNGHCKLQWKADFGMRWHALDVDYEMYGKDIIPSAELAKKISKILGKKAPYNFHYELFLDDKGQKISKSKGNGISIEKWLRYAPKESLAYYMFNKPKTAKRLHFDIIPKATDEYLNFINRFHDLDSVKQLDNPVYHVHNSNVPEINMGNISFSLLLNLASACNPDNKDILWGFISKYDKTLNADLSPFLDVLVEYAVNYYNDFIKAHKSYREATKLEYQAILRLKEDLKNTDTNDAKQLQNIVYQIGNDFNFELKDWFKALYEILLGQSTGPRMGSFISLFGINETIKLIEEKIN